jgi:cleavage and polyadenylation specificity factor subunit 1
MILISDPQSLSGNRLIRRADFHVGHFLTKIIKTRKLAPRESKDDQAGSFLGVTTSREGSLGFISAVNERMYRRLNILQGQLLNNEEQPGGLNPRAHRLSTYESRTSNPSRGVLDKDVLAQFTQLSGQRRAEYAKKSGISVARLLSDLVEIERSLPYL